MLIPPMCKTQSRFCSGDFFTFYTLSNGKHNNNKWK